MGLLNRAAAQAASRLGAREVAIPIRAGGRDVVVGFQRQPGGTQVFWGWGNTSKGADHYVRPDNISRHDVRRVFDDVTRFIADEMAARPPQRYYFSGLTGGHSRRYARDVERLARGSGYRARDLGGEVHMLPGIGAYANYAAPGVGFGLGGAGLWALEANARR